MSTENKTSSGTFERTIPTVVPFLLIVVGLGGAFFASLNVDECITYWVVKDGLSELFYRDLHFQGQSPFYFLTVWGTGKILGWNEWILRIPTLLFLALSCLALYRLAREFYDRFSSRIAVAGFVAVWIFLEGAVNTRPYNLAILCCLLSVWMLVRWVRTGDLKYRLAFVISAALISYAHILFTPVLGLHFLLFFILKPANGRPKVMAHLLNLVAIALLISPNAYQLSLLIEKRHIYSHPPMPSLAELIRAWFPRNLAGFAIASLAMTWIIRRKTGVAKARLTSRGNLLALVWWLCPALGAFAFSWVAHSSIFGVWYYSWFVPGYGLLFAGIVASLVPKSSRILAGNIYLACLMLAMLVRPWTPEDWRGAVQHLRDNTTDGDVVLVWPGLSETRALDWVDDPGMLELRVEEALELYPSTEKGLWLLTRSILLEDGSGGGTLASEAFLERQLEAVGFETTRREDFGSVKVLRLEERD
jgi:hypothetical protein